MNLKNLLRFSGAVSIIGMVIGFGSIFLYMIGWRDEKMMEAIARVMLLGVPLMVVLMVIVYLGTLKAEQDIPPKP